MSRRLVDNYVAKYLFKFVGRSVPKAVIVQDGKFKGLTFQRVDIDNGKLVELTGDTFNVESELLISSIGSLPEETPSLPISDNFLKTGTMAFPKRFSILSQHNLWIVIER